MRPAKSDGEGDASRRKRVLGITAILLFVAALVWILLDRDDGLASDHFQYVPVPGFPDVHGLAVDPQEPRFLYIATHHGLLRAENGSDFARVGDLQNDYMGFTAHPSQSGVFWASGHPASGGNMGVRKSTDGGFTWEQLAFDGKVDFHAMAISPADPDRLWGYFRGEVQRSDDGGHTWRVVSAPPVGVLSFAPDPEDPDTVRAATQGGLLVSHDAGATWQVEREGIFTTLAVHPSSHVQYAARTDGIERSSDGGQTWEHTPWHASGTVGYLALHPQDPDTLYAATFAAGLYRSTDGGASWTVLKAPNR